MNRWLTTCLLLGFITFSKAHHFVRLVILAGLGLAGLWMLHTLAQDFNKITHTNGGGAGGKILLKRSVDVSQYPQINWELVLSRDPASCARSFICQLAAQKDENLSNNERLILQMTKHSSTQDSWASKQLIDALKNGERSSSLLQCMKIYKLCPFSSKTMMMLIQMFSS